MAEAAKQPEATAPEHVMTLEEIKALHSEAEGIRKCLGFKPLEQVNFAAAAGEVFTPLGYFAVQKANFIHAIATKNLVDQRLGVLNPDFWNDKINMGTLGKIVAYVDARDMDLPIEQRRVYFGNQGIESPFLQDPELKKNLLVLPASEAQFAVSRAYKQFNNLNLDCEILMAARNLNRQIMHPSEENLGQISAKAGRLGYIRDSYLNVGGFGDALEEIKHLHNESGHNFTNGQSLEGNDFNEREAVVTQDCARVSREFNQRPINGTGRGVLCTTGLRTAGL